MYFLKAGVAVYMELTSLFPNRAGAEVGFKNVI